MFKSVALTPSQINQLIRHKGSFVTKSLDQLLAALREQKMITTEQYQLFLQKYQRQPVSQVIDALASETSLAPEVIQAIHCALLGTLYVDLDNYVPEKAALDQISMDAAIRYNMLPLAVHSHMIIIAFSDPADEMALNAAMFQTSLTVICVVASQAQIFAGIDKFYGSSHLDQLVRTISSEMANFSNGQFTSQESLERLANQHPLVQLVNNLIFKAVSAGASDINIRPSKNKLLIYNRIDGQMIRVHQLNIELLLPIIARIKIISHMDVAEHRLPQDGHMHMHFKGRKIDIRVSVMPTVMGESAVIRILDSQVSNLDIEQLGMLPSQLESFKQIISKNNGICLITGPTGSGKSTTLYAVLNQRKHLPRHIITIEEPVEYQIEGIEQINVNNKIGYTFARALRNILRHDPDDILIGEMRDYETAEIAINASLTGHFVMSTLHTNDAASTVIRLIEMGVQPYMIASSIVGVTAQRLLRKLCPHCKTKVVGHPQLLQAFGLKEGTEVYEANECRQCHHTGHKGRTMLCEVLTFDEAIRNLICEDIDLNQLRKQAILSGMIPIKHHAKKLIEKGIISLEEAMLANIS